VLAKFTLRQLTGVGKRVPIGRRLYHRAGVETCGTRDTTREANCSKKDQRIVLAESPYQDRVVAEHRGFDCAALFLPRLVSHFATTVLTIQGTLCLRLRCHTRVTNIRVARPAISYRISGRTDSRVRTLQSSLWVRATRVARMPLA